MTTYIVQIEATFSDTVEIEADTWDEAMAGAVEQFNDEYQVVNPFGLPWDNVEAVTAYEMDEDGNY